MSNPWNIVDPFVAMFDETLLLTGKRKVNNTATSISCMVTACTYPQEQVETFTDTDEESKLKKRKVLIQRTPDLSVVPQIGDKLLIDGANWSINSTEDVQQWYDIEVRK